MIVMRVTMNIKPGRMEEAAALLKAEIDRSRPSSVHRVYVPNVAPFDVLAVEGEWESVAESEKWFAEYGASPGWADFQKQFVELRASGGTNEYWELVE